MQITQFEIFPLLKNCVQSITYFEASLDELHKYKILPKGNSIWLISLDQNPFFRECCHDFDIEYRCTFIGPQTSALALRAEHNSKFLVITFYPSGINTIFNIDVSKYFNVITNASEQFSCLKNIECDLVRNRKKSGACISFLQEMLVYQLKTNKKNVDQTLFKVLEVIHQSKDIISIAQLAQTALLSQSTFTRKFTKTVGVKPKLYCRIMRFNAIFDKIYSRSNVPHSELIFEFNYYDHNHFIKEYKEFTGTLPKQIMLWKPLL